MTQVEAVAQLRKKIELIGVGASEGYALACMDIGVLFDETLAATSVEIQQRQYEQTGKCECGNICPCHARFCQQYGSRLEWKAWKI